MRILIYGDKFVLNNGSEVFTPATRVNSSVYKKSRDLFQYKQIKISSYPIKVIAEGKYT